MTNREKKLAELFKAYNLEAEDVYQHKHYTIITRNGVQKIEKALGCRCRFNVEYIDATTVVIKGTLERPKPIVVNNAAPYSTWEFAYETFASASPDTSQNKYYAEMAEKRCRSRLVLTVAGLYELGGVYGQDEADEFSEKSAPTKVVYKGQ